MRSMIYIFVRQRIMKRKTFYGMIIVAVGLLCSTQAFAKCWPEGNIPWGAGKDGDTCCNGAQMNKAFGWSCPAAPSRPAAGAASEAIVKAAGNALKAPVPSPPAPVTSVSPPQRLDALALFDMSSLSPQKRQTLIGNAGAGLIGNTGAALIGNAGAGLAGNSGGALIGNAGAGLTGYTAQSLNPSEMVISAFQKAFGRRPNDAELESWINLKRKHADLLPTQNDMALIATFRAFLRQPIAEQERQGMIRRAFDAAAAEVKATGYPMVVDSWNQEVSKGVIYEDLVVMIKNNAGVYKPSGSGERHRPGGHPVHG